MVAISPGDPILSIWFCARFSPVILTPQPRIVLCRFWWDRYPNLARYLEWSTALFNIVMGPFCNGPLPTFARTWFTWGVAAIEIHVVSVLPHEPPEYCRTECDIRPTSAWSWETWGGEQCVVTPSKSSRAVNIANAVIMWCSVCSRWRWIDEKQNVIERFNKVLKMQTDGLRMSYTEIREGSLYAKGQWYKWEWLVDASVVVASQFVILFETSPQYYIAPPQILTATFETSV